MGNFYDNRIYGTKLHETRLILDTKGKQNSVHLAAVKLWIYGDIKSSAKTENMDVPIIDFAKCRIDVVNDEDITDADLLGIGKKLYEAFTNAGFVYLKNCGISEKRQDELREISADFFSQPLEYKMKFCSKGLGLCYDPIGELNANLDRPHDFHEGVRFPAYSKDIEWPEISNLELKVNEIQKLCRILTMRVLKAFGRGMKLHDPDLFAKSHELIGKHGNTTCLKFIHYPPITPDVKLLENQIRLGEHEDFGSLSFLFQDKIGGLQVQTLSGEFVDAPPIPDTVLVNIGEMMHFWSGRRLRSTTHRVVNPTDLKKATKSRRSFVYFVNVDEEVMLNELDFDDNIKKDENYEAMTSKQLIDKLFTLKYYNPKNSKSGVVNEQ